MTSQNLVESVTDIFHMNVVGHIHLFLDDRGKSRSYPKKSFSEISENVCETINYFDQTCN